MKLPESPFSIVAFAPLLAEDASGLQPAERPPAVSSVDQGLALLAPSLYIPLPPSLSPECGILLEFRQLDDFRPEQIIARTPWLKALAADSRQERTGRTAPADHNDPLDSILEMVSLPEETTAATGDAVQQTEAGNILAGVLRRIFTDDGFRRMEAAWCGVALLFKSHSSGPLSVLLVPVHRDTAVEVIERTAAQLDADPPDLVLCDMPFDATPPGMQILESASGLAERLLTPLLCWCGPDFFSIDGWDKLSTLPYLPHHLNNFSHARWKTLRKRQAACWTMALCNSLVIRRPYRCDAEAGFFQEQAPLPAAPVWGAAALILKAVMQTGSIGRAAAQHLQPVEDLDTFQDVTEATVPGERQQQLLACGIIPLVSSPNSSIAIPGLLSIDGGSPAAILALSRIIHSLIRLRRAYGPADDVASLAAKLQYLYTKLIRDQIVSDIHELMITPAGMTDEGSSVLAVTLKPSGAEGTKIIEFTFDW